MAAGGGQAARAAAEPPCAGGSLWPARRSRQAAARAACAGRLQAALARVTDLEAECARLQAELGHALDASQAVATAAARAAAQEARGSAAPAADAVHDGGDLPGAGSGGDVDSLCEDSADLDGKRDPLLRAAVPEVVARLALVAPVMAADLLNEPAATLDVGRRNVVSHNPTISAAEVRRLSQRALNRLQRSAAPRARRGRHGGQPRHGRGAGVRGRGALPPLRPAGAGPPVRLRPPRGASGALPHRRQPAARSAAEGVPASWEVACRRGRSLPAGARFALADRARLSAAPVPAPLASGPRWWKGDLERAEQGSARQLACHEFGGGLKELDGFNHSAACASAASSAPPSACDADFVVAEGPEALAVGAAADDVDDGQGDASVVFISADGLEEGPEEDVVEEVHGDVLELVVGDAAALAPAPQLGAAVRARLRLDRLRLQVVKGAAVPIDDRDLRRPGWQAADAAAGVEVPPTPAQQREGLRWVRRLLADPGAWHGGAVWEPESIEEAARRIDGEGSRRARRAAR
ncbi:unnamed protein product [Prorocentrum cordatum]|uniref:Uncharacterized protein n=1 Tax=Prorocentrum cordatum TaxID=2364126 RepID=A0ABN9UQ35_9DINO|nr:unnamed protein product [Polarella glacialis]